MAGGERTSVCPFVRPAAPSELPSRSKSAAPLPDTGATKEAVRDAKHHLFLSPANKLCVFFSEREKRYLRVFFKKKHKAWSRETEIGGVWHHNWPRVPAVQGAPRPKPAEASQAPVRKSAVRRRGSPRSFASPPSHGALSARSPHPAGVIPVQKHKAPSRAVV